MEPMHTIGGVMKDMVKCLQSLRYTPDGEVAHYERQVNKRTDAYMNDKPWQLNAADLQSVKQGAIIASRLRVGRGGKRLTRVFDASKKSRTHTYFLLAGPIGIFILLHAKHLNT